MEVVASGSPTDPELCAYTVMGRETT
jgi:hypothetical protein